MDFRRFLGEQETKNGAQYLKPSAEMVRVYSSWSAARDGTSSRGSGAHLGCKIRRPLQVMDGCKRAWNSGELDGARWKKGYGGSGRLPGELRQRESVHPGLGAVDGARKPRDLSKVHPEVLDKRRQQYFPALRYMRETGPLRGKQKKMVGESGEKRCTAREWAKRVG